VVRYWLAGSIARSFQVHWCGGIAEGARLTAKPVISTVMGCSDSELSAATDPMAAANGRVVFDIGGWCFSVRCLGTPQPLREERPCKRRDLGFGVDINT
jgi:hypothetical protein